MRATTWTPHEVETNPLRHHTLEELTSLLGTRKLTEPVGFPAPSLTEVPESFDTREKWPQCVQPIMNQG